MKRLRDRECRNRSSYDPFRVIRLPTRRFRGRCPRLLTPALPGQRALDTDFSPGTRSGSEDERGKGSRKTQNNGNKAKKLLKTKDLKFCKVQKRTENELKFECQMRGLDSKSGFGTSPNPVIPGEGGMILRLTTAHENGLVGVKPCVFNKSSGHFQGSRSCPSADGHPETMKMNRPLTPTPLPLFPLPWGEGRGERGDRVRGVFRTRHFQSSEESRSDSQPDPMVGAVRDSSLRSE